MKHNVSITYILFILLFHCMGIFRLHAYGYNKTAEEYDKEIKRLFQVNRIDSMKIVLDQALKLYPNDTDLNRWAGTYFLQRKEIDNARYFFIKAIEQDSDNEQAKWQLIALEEGQGNISSAICYVNELLELYPYDRELWKKKIGLYRKQGNDVEADRLIKRLYAIYPNDSIVRNDYINRLDEIYVQQRKEGKKDEAIITLKTLIDYRNNEKAYYLDLGNLLFQQGHSEEAVAIISQGLEYFPKDDELLRKKAEIMAGRGYSKEAVSLLQKSQSKTLYPVADELMIEAARNESWKDPYLLYGRIYETRKSDEALDYLIRNSILRGYNDDALYYLSEYRKKHGNSPEILYKEYRIFRKIGDIKSALRVLEEYVSINRSDKDMANELAAVKIDLADGLMRDGNFQEAITYLESAQRLTDESETVSSARNKLLLCYLNVNKNSQVLALVDSIRILENNPLIYAEQKAEALHKMGNSVAAIAEMENAGKAYSEMYEQISLEYVKKLMQEGANEKAYIVCKNWVEQVPRSQYGLMYAVSASESMGLFDEADEYITKGREIYPEEPFFVLKEAASLYRKKEYQLGMDMLSPWIDSLPGNKEIAAAYFSHVLMRAQDYLNEKDPDRALSVLERTKNMDSVNQEMFLIEGKAYEMKGDYRAAYVAYAQYKPEALWIKEYKRKLMAVQNRGYKNVVTADVLNGWYAEGGRPNTIISTSYSRKMKRDYITSTLNLSYRNYSKDNSVEASDADIATDNTGAQLRVDWGHTYNERWSSVLGLAAANSIFPTWLGQAGVFYMFPKEVEMGITMGYRRNYAPASVVLDNNVRSGNMYNMRLSGNVYKEFWRINTNCDAFMINKNIYFNLNSQFKYYPTYDGDTHIMISAGAGTAPEIDFVDRLMPGSFEHLNASLGVGGVYMVSKNISLGLTVSYHYFYNQAEKNAGDEENDSHAITQYKNLYDIYTHIIFSF